MTIKGKTVYLPYEMVMNPSALKRKKLKFRSA